MSIGGKFHTKSDLIDHFLPLKKKNVFNLFLLQPDRNENTDIHYERYKHIAFLLLLRHVTFYTVFHAIVAWGEK